MKKLTNPTPCLICGTKVECKTEFNYCSSCNKLKSSIKLDLSNKRINESDSDFNARKEVYKSINFFHELFNNKTIPKNYEIISEFLKLKNYLFNNSEYKIILEKIELYSSTTEKPKKENICILCSCTLSDSVNSNKLCESCDLLINYKKLL